STAETLTNKTFLGYPVYRKVVNFGALPNATTKYVAHGIQTPYTVISLTGIATNANDYLTLPHVYFGDNTYAVLVQINRNTNQVEVGTAVDRSAYNAKIIIEYIKN
nr:hypothetical protein [Candidatus Pacearchaeota archaeon]